jgi:NADH dehydrogenase FAD-containing subunit
MRRDRDIASPLCRQSCSFQNANKVEVKLPTWLDRRAASLAAESATFGKTNPSGVRLARVQFLASAKLTSKLGLRHATNCNEPEEMKKTRVVIAGGGFAGLYAAKYFDKHLARRPDVEVTLISRENFILFTPMLHEVAAGDLSPSDIVNPLRRILRHVKFVEADVQDVDLNARKIRCIHGIGDAYLELEYDHLLLALGSETNFFDNQGLREWAVTMKNVMDATLLRNRMVALLEEAALEKDENTRREVLTFVTAGGGFAGAETTGAVNDFLRETARFYPPTAQHGLREGVVAAKNIERTALGQPLKPFRFKTLGLLAAIGHHTGVAMVFGMKFSGFIARWLWRSVYLLKLPRLAKKLRVVIAWTLDLFFGRDITQIITLRDVEEISDRLARIRAHRKQAASMATESALDSSTQTAITRS